METRGRRVHSVEKAIRLLDCFWEEGEPLSISNLEKKTGWAKSTIHGLLASMLESGVIEQNPGDGKYRLGYHLFELGSSVNLGWSVPEVCRPHLQKIVDAFNESVYLARLSGDELILAECEEPHNGFRISSEVGTRLPLHCSSQGKVLLAYRSQAEAERLLTKRPLQKYTLNTVTSVETLLKALDTVKKQGYAEEHQEYKRGLMSVAAPVFERGGQCTYAVGLICLSSVEERDFDIMRRVIISEAAAISRELGGL